MAEDNGRKMNTAGNRFSLRNSAMNQIKRVESISTFLGPVGDLLVSTWGGILMGLLTLVGTVFLVVMTLSANGGHTLLQNSIPAIIIAISGAIIAVNVMMTNPSQGSQLKVSLAFLLSHIHNKRSAKASPLNIFRVSKNDPAVCEYLVNGKVAYLAVYVVRGVVSQVSFPAELEIAEALDRQLLLGLERDTTMATANLIQKMEVSKIPLSNVNATPAMKRRRDRLYNIAKNIPNNQSLHTVVTFKCDDPMILSDRVRMAETVFAKGLTVGYERLKGDEMKAEVKRIYG